MISKLRQTLIGFIIKSRRKRRGCHALCLTGARLPVRAQLGSRSSITGLKVFIRLLPARVLQESWR